MNRKKLKKMLAGSIVGSGGYDSNEQMLEILLSDPAFLTKLSTDSGIKINVKKIIEEGKERLH
ncbi:MAG: hypothetical protein QM504_03795 [Pseudomonadota bacterium]